MAYKPKRRKRTPSRSKRNGRVIKAGDDEKASGVLKLLAAGEGTTVETDFVTEMQTKKPDYEDLTSVFEQCDYWSRESDFLKVLLPLKSSIFNYEFRLRCKEEADQERLVEWLAEICPPMIEEYKDPSSGETIKLESNATNAERIFKFVQDCWFSYLLYDNLTIAWFDDGKFPLTLDLTRCEYRDVFGAEILSYQHGVSQQDAEMFEDKMAESLKESQIVFDVNAGQHFKVLKRSVMGTGYGVPSLFSLFVSLAQREFLQYGLSTMAYATQLVTRHHKLGHEIKQGDRAGQPNHFWNKRRSDAVLKKFVKVKGFQDYTSNFDETIDYPWPDLKIFDETAMKGSNETLNRWGGPIAQMMRESGTGNPFLTGMIRAEAKAERERMRLFLGPVLHKAFKLPVEQVEIVWGSGIFSDSRIRAEMMKFGAQVGWTSVRSGREECGLDDADERAQKRKEADDPDARKTSGPMFDTSHGIFPGLGDRIDAEAKAAAKGKEAGAKVGRPPGSTE